MKAPGISNLTASPQAKRKNKKLEEVCEQVTTGEMPLPSYLWIHRDAALREGDANILCDWANQTRQSLQVN